MIGLKKSASLNYPHVTSSPLTIVDSSAFQPLIISKGFSPLFIQSRNHLILCVSQGTPHKSVSTFSYISARPVFPFHCFQTSSFLTSSIQLHQHHNYNPIASSIYIFKNHVWPDLTHKFTFETSVFSIINTSYMFVVAR